MKNQLKILNVSLLVVILAFSGCKKKETESTEEKVPVADFVSDKAEYNAGDVIKLTSTSTDAETFRWTLPNGTTAKSSTAAYPTPDLLPDVTKYLFKLEAISKGGLKSDYTVKEIWVKPSTGKVTFYYVAFFSGYFNVLIDGKSIGTITFPANQQKPAGCDQGGYVTKELPVGTHVVSIGVWSKSFEVKKNDCTILQVDP